MYWPIRELDPAIRQQLVQVSKTGGLSTCPSYFESKKRRGQFVMLGILSLLGGAAVMLLGPIGIGAGSLALIWSLVLFAEAARGDPQPFVLITPRAVIRFDHGHLEAYKLADATDFSSIQTYDQKQDFKGLQYVFKFPESTFVCTISSDLGAFEQILAKARAGAADLGPCGLDLIPSKGGSAKRPMARAFTNPFGEFWIGLLVLAIVAVIVLIGIFGK